MSELSRLSGYVSIRPGERASVACERPVVRDGLLGVLLRGCRLSQVPGQLAATFSLCGDVHRLTAMRAIRAALGQPTTATEAERESCFLHAIAMRDHALRLGLDLPIHTRLRAAVDPAWLREIPGASGVPLEQASALRQRLTKFLEGRLWGTSVALWQLRVFDAATLAVEAARRAAEPGPWAWLDRAARVGEGISLRLRSLPDLASREVSLELAESMRSGPSFCARPSYRGHACETGPWSRLAQQGSDGDDERERVVESDVWQLVAARVLELARLCAGEQSLHCGALRLGPAEALAYTQMSRGSVVHWLRLRPSSGGANEIAVDDYRVLAPTEWNFHPEGALAAATRGIANAGERLRLLVHAFDPCVDVRFQLAEQ